MSRRTVRAAMAAAIVALSTNPASGLAANTTNATSASDASEASGSNASRANATLPRPESNASDPGASVYDCNAFFADWEEAWSASKKKWCCAHTGRGCSLDITTATPGASVYDCNAGFANWEEAWSASKKTWCCSHASKGCPLERKTTIPTTTTGRVKPGCETATPGSGACWDEVEWARTRGIHEHPDWYPGLGPGSSVAEFQQMVHHSSPDKCPAPCLTANIGLWCSAQEAPELWGPDLTGPAVNIKVLAYNLFWWNLFGQRGGNGNSAGWLISGSMDPEPYDFMGFQECESPERVLGPVGLLNEYATVRGTHAICAAYRKTAWELLAHGEGDVGEDIATNHYGRRGAQWLRLKHKENGKVVFFVNHHGPLAVNSGGTCGGTATAVNLMKLMATHGQRGDALVLVGDFNANAASLTIQSMWSKLVHVFNGVSFGGVDNIFSNIPLSHVVRTENLGSGGSDHDAIAAVMQLGGADPSPGPRAGEPLDALRAMTGTGHPGDDWQHFWCGLMESDIAYVVASDTWSKRLDHQLPTTDVASPSRCCRICQREADCRSWKWEKNGSPSARPACWLQGEAPEAKVLKMGAVSGLPASTAAVLATRASAMALVAMP